MFLRSFKANSSLLLFGSGCHLICVIVAVQKQFLRYDSHKKKIKMGQKSTWKSEWMFNTSKLVAVMAISLLLQQRCYFTFWKLNIEGKQLNTVAASRGSIPLISLTFFVWTYSWAVRSALHIDVWSDWLSFAAASSRSPSVCTLGRSRFLEGVQTQRELHYGRVHQSGRGAYGAFALDSEDPGLRPARSQRRSITQHKVKIHEENSGSLFFFHLVRETSY